MIIFNKNCCSYNCLQFRIRAVLYMIMLILLLCCVDYVDATVNLC
jgi:hypothetical protein